MHQTEKSEMATLCQVTLSNVHSFKIVIFNFLFASERTLDVTFFSNKSWQPNADDFCRPTDKNSLLSLSTEHKSFKGTMARICIC